MFVSSRIGQIGLTFPLLQVWTAGMAQVNLREQAHIAAPAAVQQGMEQHHDTCAV
jgi:hypothetical protein